MKKKIKIITSSVLTALLLMVGVHAAIAAQSSGGSTSTLYVQGSKITKNEGQPISRTDTVFVPVEPVLKGMGDKLSWIDEPNSALITKKDGTKINIYVGKSSAIVDGKAVPISTKVINTVTVPVPIKPTTISGKLYVPIEFLQEVLGYNVKVKENGNTEYVIVGTAPTGDLEPVEDTPAPTATPTPTPEPTSSKPWKPDLPYLPPSGWTAPQIKSTSTDNLQKDSEILERELGFLNGRSYNIYGTTNNFIGNEVIVGSHPDYLVNIEVKSWYGSKNGEDNANKIPYVMRELFKFYFPQKYETLFKIMDYGVNGKDVSKYVNKPFTLDGREVKIVEGPSSVSIMISHKK
ncbi:copper amine oxidase N-terminal domain-containing protein [Paenibacillus cellulositrophicus]|uniref:copper amine oxidase N-terminal domain-containing protein n=1 Tax=Paenibacillus cellulositrophicus TaxID=562959 RepID=UPI00203D1802|nr:copper amine oxidase N-terminal domain-containing protein [Paenibacillus cellulositrophicus]MCM2999990.1 copper amine oxidase N-terminal domain-containing protein [Paenibacillus cellulositrophicus]